MEILLVRHTESEKNVVNSFSSVEDAEPLTEMGVITARKVALSIYDFANRRGLRIKSVYSASSTRAKETATVIAKEFGAPVSDFNSLRSIDSGILSGISETEAGAHSNEFIWQLNLYRTGLYNSYDIRTFEGRENLRDFERRIQEAIDRILFMGEDTLKIMVLHRSPITATLLRFARDYHNYPRDFYGYVPLELGSISWVHQRENGLRTIMEVNISSEQLENL